MAGYGGGRKTGVNVSQYIADLNKEPSTFDFEQSEDNINIDEELAQFTNTEFLDFDSTSFLDGNASGMDFSADNAEGDVMKAENASKAPGLDFSKGDIPIPDIYNFASPTSPTTPLDGSQTHQQPHRQHPHPPPHPHHAQPPSGYPYYAPAFPYPTGPQPHSGPSIAPSNQPSHASIPHPGSTGSGDETVRAAAEEDKRRRNTAASARFRVKKKEREKALESKTSELEKKNQSLEQRIGQLETENEWLRGLVVEKQGVAIGPGARGRWKEDKEAKESGAKTAETANAGEKASKEDTKRQEGDGMKA